MCIRDRFYINEIKTWKISTPSSDPNRILLYFHGGAYSLGSPKSHYSLVSYLAEITKTTIYVPNYRLGPESKYPSQLNDALTVYEYLLNEKKINFKSAVLYKKEKSNLKSDYIVHNLQDNPWIVFPYELRELMSIEDLKKELK